MHSTTLASSADLSSMFLTYSPLFSMIGRPFYDTVQLPLGPACGVQRTGYENDHEVLIEMYFDMPAMQSAYMGG